ncbi:uncharacterized protein PITG_06300 [Phytophthora infestans T30-4]|uniref:Uncharacterized protein n=1 Tax=Phytophthora infestans (strain T30-4) TaxID=403677 RepID=D0N4J5_PHYIT|nr:uncharacterized protein PITG_06300 [Phytophthora infestans T30-4]EEY69803.1 hypothetical protein PITG_06300 [Phytophthora infestans T30-4]|eukprot:XP_002998450.1 hypothetical protein PITG_06300 [Phytophthora infestans T30-4]
MGCAYGSVLASLGRTGELCEGVLASLGRTGELCKSVLVSLGRTVDLDEMLLAAKLRDSSFSIDAETLVGNALIFMQSLPRCG